MDEIAEEMFVADIGPFIALLEQELGVVVELIAQSQGKADIFMPYIRE